MSTSGYRIVSVGSCRMYLHGFRAEGVAYPAGMRWAPEARGAGVFKKDDAKAIAAEIVACAPSAKGKLRIEPTTGGASIDF